MNIIIYGTSEMSALIAKELNEVHDITIIGIPEELPEEFSKFDISYICGKGSSLKSLETAGVKKADVFIACTQTDEANIVAAWTAKRISSVETVCFVSKSEYLESFSLATKTKNNTEIGIDHIIWPELLLTQEIFRIVSVPDALDVEFFAGGRARLLEYRIKENAIILNKPIKNCYFPDDTIIVGITREEKLFIPDGNTEFLLDDKVIFMGTETGLNILASKFFEQRKKTRTAAIIGGGSVGYMLASDLEKVGIKTKLLELSDKRCEFLSDELKKTLVIKGDGTDLEILESEDIGDMDVLISVTNNDEKNLLCSLLGKQLGVQRVITRVSKARNIRIFEKVGIDVAVSPKEAALKEIRDKILEKDIDILALVEKGQGEVIEITMPDNFNDIKIMDIKMPVNAIISAIRRGSKILIPKGNTYIRACDYLIVFTTAENAIEVKEFFKNDFSKLLH